MSGRHTCFLLMLLALIPGCLPLTSRQPAVRLAGIASQAENVSTPAPLDRLSPADYPGEIARLETILSSVTAPSPSRAEAGERLAMLHLLQTNPGRDPGRAEMALEKSLAATDSGQEKVERQIWLGLLRDNMRYERKLAELNDRLTSKIEGLRAENEKLSDRFKTLQTTNSKLKEDIEKLKLIDLSVERKRKNFR